jgi:hypothetical protein
VCVCVYVQSRFRSRQCHARVRLRGVNTCGSFVFQAEEQVTAWKQLREEIDSKLEHERALLEANLPSIDEFTDFASVKVLGKHGGGRSREDKHARRRGRCGSPFS